MRKLVIIVLIVFVTLGMNFSAGSVATQRKTMSHSEWVAQTLAAIQTIKVGMTRKDLLKLFTVEGGISTRNSRTFVFRECSYIKVDVGFEPMGATEDQYKIIRISKPYLAQSVID